MQVGVKSSPDSFSAIAFILSKYRIVSSEFEEIMKLIDKEIKKTIPPYITYRDENDNKCAFVEEQGLMIINFQNDNFVKKYIL